MAQARRSEIRRGEAGGRAYIFENPKMVRIFPNEKYVKRRRLFYAGNGPVAEPRTLQLPYPLVQKHEESGRFVSISRPCGRTKDITATVSTGAEA